MPSWTTRPLDDTIDRRSPQRFIASPTHDHNLGADVNRPLPPLPVTRLDYDIPALRRKTESDSPKSNGLKHNRSFSHPFPSFFGGKKGDKKTAVRHEKPAVITVEGASSINANAGSPSRKPQNPSRHPSVKAERQPVTGKCMTCDSTMRWPQDVKVFRCTICLTINDLEPYAEHRGGPRISEQQPYFVTARKPIPLSLHRTRALIDLCVGDYLEKQLEDISCAQEGPTDLPPPPSVFDAIDTPEHLQFSQDEDGIAPAPLSPGARLRLRSPSDSKVPPRYSNRNGINTASSGPALGPSTTEKHANDLISEGIPRLDNRVLHPVPNSTNASSTIFSTLESYISASFTTCAALNSSFFTIKPQVSARVDSADDQNPEAHSENGPADAGYGELIMSELDAKTLLLGDFAENGSWWTGSRVDRTESQSRHSRDRSPETWRGVVSAKTPRINWLELAEWYHLVTHAGEDWRKKWHDLRPTNSTSDLDRTRRWHALQLDVLQRTFLEAQAHLQRKLLKATEELVKRPGRPLKHPEDCRFLLMLLANPLLHSGSVPATQLFKGQNQSPAVQFSQRAPSEHISCSPSKRIRSSSRKGGTLGQHSGIVKRILGLISNLTNETHQFIVAWISRFSDTHFQRLVDLIGSFVTHRLTRQPARRANEYINPTAGLVPSFSDSGVRHPSQLHAALDVRPTSSAGNSSDGKPKLAVYSEDWQVRAAARVMALLFAANSNQSTKKRDGSNPIEQRTQTAGLNARHSGAHVHGQIIPISSFYNTMLDYADLLADFEAWETTKGKLTFCQYPFFLSIYAKIHILEHDAKRQMENKAREAFFDSILSRKAISQYLVLKVRRDCLVEDSLRNVSEVVGSGADDIKKGLKIDFVGEEGIDAGGLRKEWFLLLVREIFDPHHGLFLYDEDSQFCYFNPFCFESSEQFFLVGVLLGLAIYNSTILDVAFPPFVFKKLLASAPASTAPSTTSPRQSHTYTLEDLAEYRPALARGLRQLLEFEGDVQETFCRDFVAEMDRYGENVSVALCSGGQKRPVTNSNRREFVDLYVHYLLDSAVVRQYEPFKRGFFNVCGGNALSLFRPEEIELLVRGSDEPLDITSLRAVAIYDGWPKPAEQQPQVVWFWEFFERAVPADQRKLLSFITGSDRIPAMGATNLHIRIALLRNIDKMGKWMGDERFPTARTCFNTLSLYAYGSREKLEKKLWTAVTGSEGFGLK